MLSGLPAGWLFPLNVLHEAVHAASALGVPDRELDAAVRESAATPAGELVLVPDEIVYRVVEFVLDAAGSDAPLFDAVCLRSDDGQSMLELAMVASDNLGEAFGRACRYEAFWSTSIELDLVQFAGTSKVVCCTVAPPSRGRNATVAALLATLMRAVERALGRAPDLAEVRLQWEPIVDPDRVVKHLGIRTTFGAHEDALVFHSSLLGEPLPRAYRPFADFFDRDLERVIESLPSSPDLQRRVIRALADRLVDGEAHALQHVARELGQSPRTLQRRLQAEGTTFTAMVERARLDLARVLLEAGENSVGEVAFALGFSTPAAFGRAFKRWTGQTPGAFRV